MKKLIDICVIILVISFISIGCIDYFERITKIKIENTKLIDFKSISVDISIIDLSEIEYREVGICYSNTNTIPTIDDSIIYLHNIDKGIHVGYIITNNNLATTNNYYRLFCKENDKIIYSNVEQINFDVSKLINVGDQTFNYALINVTASNNVLNKHSILKIYYWREGTDYKYCQLITPLSKNVEVSLNNLIPNCQYSFYITESIGETVYRSQTYTNFIKTKPHEIIKIKQISYSLGHNINIWSENTCYGKSKRGVQISSDVSFNASEYIEYKFENVNSFSINTKLNPAVAYYIRPTIQLLTDSQTVDTIIYGSWIRYKMFEYTEPLDSTVIDIDGNVYKIANVEHLAWMTENLKTTRFNNGKQIEFRTSYQLDFWKDVLTTHPSYTFLNNNSTYMNYGIFYNRVVATDVNICPEGWRLPKIEEFNLHDSIFYKINSQKLNSGIMSTPSFYWNDLSYIQPEVGIYTFATQQGNLIVKRVDKYSTIIQGNDGGNTIRCVKTIFK